MEQLTYLAVVNDVVHPHDGVRDRTVAVRQLSPSSLTNPTLVAIPTLSDLIMQIL